MVFNSDLVKYGDMHIIVKRYLELRQISRSQLEYIFVKCEQRGLGSDGCKIGKCEETILFDLFQFSHSFVLFGLVLFFAASHYTYLCDQLV